MANKYNFSLTVNGLEATANGCNVESISITSDGEFGNELVSVFGQIFEGILTKIPTPTTTATPATISEPEVKKVVEKVQVHPSTDFCEVPVPKEEKPKIKLDINKAFECLERVLTQDNEWKSYYGNLKFSETAIKAEISLQNDHIECDIYPKDANDNSVHIYIYEDRIHVDGINVRYAEKYFKESPIPKIENLWEVIKPLMENK